MKEIEFRGGRSLWKKKKKKKKKKIKDRVEGDREQDLKKKKEII